MAMHSHIAQNLSNIKTRIARAAERAGRDPHGIELVAVTKTRPLEQIQALIDAGQRVLGENRVQEALPKIAALRGQAEWHLIGHLQRNKAKTAVEGFALIHSADSDRLLESLSRAAQERGGMARVLIQVNISEEGQKFGCEAAEAPRLLELADSLPGVRIEGLMGMAALADDPEQARSAFRRLRELRDSLLAQGAPPERLRHLSMGMSHDFEIAVEEGSTLVRVGSALFHGL
ncbi:MAG: hypothetical protein BWZ10_01088 [candidate division BRC1 bacterium ADurb.BinA364]|nr:MAG: hypothetical protein BWZ10_01088 [candidate division BRC1 bacterium ADurb.BinA364]